jgi:hypothetical protein
MRSSKFTLLAIALIAGGQGRGFGQTTNSQPPASNPSPPKAEGSHAASVSLIDGAIQKLTRPEGVDVRYRLEVFGRTQPAVTTGRAVTASNKRVYVELETRQVARSARMKMICDGETFHRIESVDGKNNISSYEVKALQEALDRLATTESERVAKEDVEREQQGRHAFEGLAAMIKDLKTRMIFEAPAQTTAQVSGKTVGVKIVQGTWNKEVLDLIAPVKKGDDPNAPDARAMWNTKEYFFHVPRLARLYFETNSNELLRVEMVGIREKQGPESILTAVHFDSITPLTQLDATLFKPTPAELAYNRVALDLTLYLRSEHAAMMNRLKRIQEMQSDMGK